MKKLTHQEIMAGDVDFIIPDETPLPDQVKSELHYFSPGVRMVNKRTGQRATRYTVPASRLWEWLKIAKQEQAPAPAFGGHYPDGAPVTGDGS